jgi:hypothetical protein
MTSVLRNSSIAARPTVADFSVEDVDEITKQEKERRQPLNVSISAKNGSHSIDKVRIESLSLHNLLSKGLSPPGKVDSSTILAKTEDGSSISISTTAPSRQQLPSIKPGDDKGADVILRKSRPQSKPVLALEREICRKNDKTVSQYRGRYVGKKPPSDGDGLFIDKKLSKGKVKSKKDASLTATGQAKSRKRFFF